MNLSTPSIVPLSITRSDYDGDDVYADWREPNPGSGGVSVLLRSFEPGIGRVEPWTDSGGANTAYYHADMLDTSRMMSGPNGQPITTYNGVVYIGPAVYTAFGEIVYGPNDGAGNRYGYVGEHGYQAHSEFPYLHLGARYYDPAMGRFLQRDPIGINGGLSAYSYVRGVPTLWSDSGGMRVEFGRKIAHMVGSIVGGLTGMVTGALVCAVAPNPAAPYIVAAATLAGGSLGYDYGDDWYDDDTPPVTTQDVIDATVPSEETVWRRAFAK